MSVEMGRYVLEEKLGVGGMAEVWLATQRGPTGFSRRCVIKRVLSHLAEDVELVTMFLDEARLAAQLNHPNIVQILDFGVHEGSYFLAMEWVPGLDLRKILKARMAKGQFIPYPVAARLISQVAQALDFAHHALSPEGTPLKLVHRDVSPHNILVSSQGMVKLIDFGIAKAVTARRKTRTGVVKGKFNYMSPEQLRGEALDGRADLFALGLVFYEVLAGQAAVPRDSTQKVVQTILRGEIVPIDRLRADVPPVFRNIIEKALQASPAQRYQTGTELSHDLERYLLEGGTLIGVNHLASLLPEKSEALTTPETPEVQVDPAAPTLEVRSGGGPGTLPTQPARGRLVERAPLATPWGRVVRTVDLERPDRYRLKRRLVAAAAALVCVGAAGVLGRTFYKPAPRAPALPELPAPPPLAKPEPPPPAQVEQDPEVAQADVPLAPVPGRPTGVHRGKHHPGTSATPSEGGTPAESDTQLIARSDVPARVSVDGVMRGLAPIFVDVGPGEHTVSFTSDSLAVSHAEQVKLAAGDNREVTWHPGRGMLTVWVLPYAEVFLDGKSLGVTPFPPVQVWEGRHSLRLTNQESGRSVQRELRMVAGGEQKVSVNMENEGAP